MSGKTITLENVLARQAESLTPLLDAMRSDELKRLARFWTGSKEASTWKKADCQRELAKAMGNKKRAEETVQSLSKQQQQILAVVQRYGTVSGQLLATEVMVRKLVEKAKEEPRYYGSRRKSDAVYDLIEKLLLFTPSGSYRHYDFYYFSSYRDSYPEVILPEVVQGLIEPAAPLPWKPSSSASTPAATFQRSAAAVALDLWNVAQALSQMGKWKTIRGGSPAKSVQNKLQKLFARDERDPLLLPNIEGLYYEMLRGLGAIIIKTNQGQIDLKVLEKHLQQPAAVQAWHWVRAWLPSHLWQDGIGTVPDRDNYYDPVRIDPQQLYSARELLIWALCRVAHADDQWLEVETFLADLWSIREDKTPEFYWSSFIWNPKWTRAKGKSDIPVGAKRHLAFWLDDSGTYIANALLGTLAYLGLVERGSAGAKPDANSCFRLTPLGKAVFGAPEIAVPELEGGQQFLTVQPNFEILAYLEAADASAVWPLAQMARCVSAPGEPVQTFALSRESVYQALESGLMVDDIRQFLAEHSKTGLPANVARSLDEWGQKREALTLRTDVALGIYPPGGKNPFQDVSKARSLGEQAILLPKTAARSFKDRSDVSYHAGIRPTWKIDEEGRIQVPGTPDAVALARLAQFADPSGNDWQISAASIRRARERGIPADQILDWLGIHLTNDLPPILETAISNWSSPSKVFLDHLLLFQVNDAQACDMILNHPRFQPLFAGHVPPNWFIVHPEKRKELEDLLTQLGFALGGTYQIPKPPKPETTEKRGQAAGSRRRRR